MSSLNTAVLHVSYKAWQEIDVSSIIESVNVLESNKLFLDYTDQHLESISVEGYDVIVKTSDGKDHRLIGIIPDLVIETDHLELWNEVEIGGRTRMVRKTNTVSSTLKLGVCK